MSSVPSSKKGKIPNSSASDVFVKPNGRQEYRGVYGILIKLAVVASILVAFQCTRSMRNVRTEPSTKETREHSRDGRDSQDQNEGKGDDGKGDDGEGDDGEGDDGEGDDGEGDDGDGEHGTVVSRRTFQSYQSSEWEREWIENVNRWAESRSICDVLLNDHADRVHDFLELMCTAHMPSPHDKWCVVDDEVSPFWYNKRNRDSFEIYLNRPDSIPLSIPTPPNEPVIPTAKHEHIMSKLTFLDEKTGETYHEYIEPLISHLRFPLSRCIDTDIMNHRGYVMPLPSLEGRFEDLLYFDAGASSWDRGSGGPSLKYFVGLWERHGIKFDHVYAFDMFTSKRQFYNTVPKQYSDLIHYQQLTLSSRVEEDEPEHPFPPKLIERIAKADDYVLFKLDIDSPLVEDGIIQYILDDPDTVVDEIAWEHHIRGNYLLTKNWFPEGRKDLDKVPFVSLKESYELFLKMRQKGIRAHSRV